MKQTQRDERGRERGEEEEKEKEEEAKRERKGRDRDKEPNQREKKEADVLRHDVADILLKAKPTRSNLSTQQKKGLSYLKKNKDKIAIIPFDKGQGFVSIEQDELVKKSEAEFSNVSLDTKDTTKALQTKIQNKLRELHKQDKIDKDTYTRIYPLVSLTPTANPAIKAHKPAKNYPA